MAEKKIKSSPEIIKEFIDSIENDSSLDGDTIKLMKELYLTNKLTLTRFQQVLETMREKMEKHG